MDSAAADLGGANKTSSVWTTTQMQEAKWGERRMDLDDVTMKCDDVKHALHAMSVVAQYTERKLWYGPATWSSGVKPAEGETKCEVKRYGRT
ncbi:hypothetical protein H257_00664 [Aphanomyces astaci]|uniref:Uncharacterized protein n=1 Tax=Aphanomyces astaci TaxID=112090 RepID=W4HBF0_APHAT|nr:hypothetical protein H257_00664 [Aphanomyces astaci]ETV89345.1 hypothetical protein H257_00664 [Aphanomyces astaci]|eukprot:XP_009821745.1 hypothetical protein H257_00664 [Aphanomyces astaci]